MKNIKILTVTILIFASSVVAQNEANKTSSGSFYFHPISLILSTIPNFLWLTATYENNFADHKAFLLRPTFLRLGDSDDNFSIYGLGAGLRNYLSKPQSGIYLDLIGSLGYNTVSLESSGESVDGSGIAVSGMGHIGVKGKWQTIAIMFDIGGGYLFSTASAEDNSGNEASGSGGGPAFDINFGVGFNL